MRIYVDCRHPEADHPEAEIAVPDLLTLFEIVLVVVHTLVQSYREFLLLLPLENELEF
jgi:hypothetical protein